MPELRNEARIPRPKREEVRRRLLDAATEVFAEKGIDGAGLDEVAAAAGLTKGAIYSNFAGKDELIYALMDEHIVRRERAIEEILSDTDTPRDAINRIGAALSTAIDTEAAWQRLFVAFWSRAQKDPKLASQFRRRRATARAQLAKAIADGARRYGLVLRLEPKEIAITLLALSNGLAIERSTDPEDTGDELFARLVALMIE